MRLTILSAALLTTLAAPALAQQQMTPEQITIGVDGLSKQSQAAWLQIDQLVAQLQANVATLQKMNAAETTKVADRDKEIADLKKAAPAAPEPKVAPAVK